jgi:hypothetical protein
MHLGKSKRGGMAEDEPREVRGGITNILARIGYTIMLQSTLRLHGFYLHGFNQPWIENIPK